MSQPDAPISAEPAVDSAFADPSALLIDRRVLVFRPAMLCSTLEAAGRGRLDLPLKPVSGVELLPERQEVRFRFGADGDAVERVLNAQTIGAILIAFCIGAGIPLPTRAQKSVSVAQGGVVLTFTVSFRALPGYRRK